MASAERLIEIFNEAKARPAGVERERYLAEACPEDAALKAQVIALLQAHEGSGDFLKPTQFISPSALLTEKPGDKIGRYKLLQQIGEGGCGVVYMAEQEEPVRRRVALKVIKLGMDTKSVIARFEAERQALALMDHPNIAKVLDAGATDTGRPYFVMELVRGIKITNYCDQNNLATQDRLKLFIQVCQAIQHAHQKGIIHRDIKPSNVLVSVSEPGAPGCPKVIDFGIAKATTDQRLTDKTLFTAFEQFIGTPAYMSPEQAMLTSLDIDTRSDIYSLGALLYELLTGRTPFDQKELLQSGLDAMRRTIREQEPVKPSTRLSLMLDDERTTTAKYRQTDALKLIHLLSGDLDWIAMKCLEKNRARRYETANGLAADIQRHLNNEPVNACPPSAIYRLQKAVRRNKLAFAAAAAISTVLVAGVLVSTFEAIRATRAEHEQSQLREQAENVRNEEARERAKAEANERKAETEKAKSEQVAEFLMEMLGSVGPSVALGRDATMLREILDKTAGRLGKDLTNQPEVELLLRCTLANTYHELGLYREMEQIARQGLQLARSQQGEGDENLACMLGSLSDALMHLGNLDEAEKLARESLMVHKQQLGHEHSTATAISLNLLAQILEQENKLAEAEATYREALALQKKILGNEHPDVATSLNNLGGLLREQGKLVEAESMLREALTMRRKLFGDAHPAIAVSLDNLAQVFRKQGKLTDAETMFREGLVMRRKLLGNEHPDVATSLNNLAIVLFAQRKLPEAETLYREALAIRRKRIGNDDPRLAAPLKNLANLLEEQGKLAEAEAMLRESLSILRKTAPENPMFVAVITELTTALLADKKFAEAEALARECLSIHEKQFPDDWRTFNARSQLGDSLLGQTNYADAGPLLLSGYEGMKQREDKIPTDAKVRLQVSLQRVAQLYEATGQAEKATEWNRKLAELGQAVAGKNTTVPKP